MVDNRLTPEEITNILKEANKNYTPSSEHYLVLNSDIELNALLEAQLGKCTLTDEKLREKMALTNDEIEVAYEKGFDTRVNAYNLTDELQLKCLEGRKLVAKAATDKALSLLPSKEVML